MMSDSRNRETIKLWSPATYRIEVEGAVDKYLDRQEPFFFRTAPRVGAPSRFRVSIGARAAVPFIGHRARPSLHKHGFPATLPQQ